MLLNSHKKMLNCSLCSPKTTFIAIFGQLWMVVHIAIFFVVEFFNCTYRSRIGVCNLKVKNFEIDTIFAKYKLFIIVFKMS